MRTRPPRTRTMECSCRLCPTPGGWAVISMPEVSRTRTPCEEQSPASSGLSYRRACTRRDAAGCLQGRCLGLGDLVLAALTDQLLDGGHEAPLLFVLLFRLRLLRSDPRGRACRALWAHDDIDSSWLDPSPELPLREPAHLFEGKPWQQDVPGAGHGETVPGVISRQNRGPLPPRHPTGGLPLGRGECRLSVVRVVIPGL